ncbi:MAG: SCO6880 family protein [Nocardioidaceae bacterium]
MWMVVFVVVVAPVRGRSATGWVTASIAFAVGGLTGWTKFRSKSSRGQVDGLGRSGPARCSAAHVEVHDGPPQGASLARVAIIQRPRREDVVGDRRVGPSRASVCSESADRQRQGAGLSELLDLAARTELIDEILFTVRTVPEDGAERALWIQRHRRPNSPRLA